MGSSRSGFCSREPSPDSAPRPRCAATFETFNQVRCAGAEPHGLQPGTFSGLIPGSSGSIFGGRRQYPHAHYSGSLTTPPCTEGVSWCEVSPFRHLRWQQFSCSTTQGFLWRHTRMAAARRRRHAPRASHGGSLSFRDQSFGCGPLTRCLLPRHMCCLPSFVTVTESGCHFSAAF